MITWSIKKFEELTVHELYAILRLRSEVFVVEQTCVFQDMDNKDQLCSHLMGWESGQLIAYSRLVPPGLSYDLPSIGRVITSMTVRKRGVGRLLMEKSIEGIEALFGKTGIRIGAQLYLRDFYGSFGFLQSSNIYDEDGIDHIEMLRS